MSPISRQALLIPRNPEYAFPPLYRAKFTSSLSPTCRSIWRSNFSPITEGYRTNVLRLLKMVATSSHAVMVIFREIAWYRRLSVLLGAWQGQFRPTRPLLIGKSTQRQFRGPTRPQVIHVDPGLTPCRSATPWCDAGRPRAHTPSNFRYMRSCRCSRLLLAGTPRPESRALALRSYAGSCGLGMR